eukprot:13125_1
MLVRLFVLLPLIGLSSAVDCNSMGVGGQLFPTDVCFVTDSGSRKAVCAGSTATMQSFATADCSGDSTSIDPCELEGCSVTSTCNSSPCQYTLLEMWQGVTACDGTDPVDSTSYTTHPFLVATIELCTNTIKSSCATGVVMQTIYGEADCSDAPIGSSAATMCQVGIAMKYTCGQVAPDAEPTAQPTYGNDPEPQPTPQPTNTPQPTTAIVPEPSWPCNSLTESDEYEGTYSYPTDVCFPQGTSSMKAVCADSTATMQMFTSSDCSGTSTTHDLCDGMIDCSVTSVCNASPCVYGLVEVYTDVECDGDTAVEYGSYYAYAKIVGKDAECRYQGQGSRQVSCSEEHVYIQSDYDTNYVCSGEPDTTESMTNTCRNTVARKYSCDLVAPGTFPPTPRPTTQAPSQDPTTGAPTEATDNPTTAEPTAATQDPTTAQPTTTAEPTMAGPSSRGYAIQLANSIAFFVFVINMAMA